MPLKLKSSWVMGSSKTNLLCKTMDWNSAFHTYTSTHILDAAESWQLKHCNTKVHSPMLLFCWVLGIRRCTNEYNSFRKHSCCLALCNSKHSNWIICAKGIKREPVRPYFEQSCFGFLFKTVLEDFVTSPGCLQGVSMNFQGF